jgi:hypothetical protein
LGLLKEGQNLYSFRHSGAIDLYVKTKDLYKVQQAMGHSTLIVILGYLRSLSITANMNDDLPELRFSKCCRFQVYTVTYLVNECDEFIHMTYLVVIYIKKRAPLSVSIWIIALVSTNKHPPI